MDPLSAGIAAGGSLINGLFQETKTKKIEIFKGRKSKS